MGDDVNVIVEEVEADWSYEHLRKAVDILSDDTGEWQGIPVPLDDFTVTLCKGHPMAGGYAKRAQLDVLVGGPPHEGIDPDADIEEVIGEVVQRALGGEDERVVNHWYDGKHNREVVIFQRPNGRAFAVTVPRAPDRSMDRLTFALMTLGASDAWSLEAEQAAINKLSTHVSERALRQYLLTGLFIETSRRSGLSYVFRRLRPTVVLTPRWPWYRPDRDSMRVLAVLCMHPIGFYDDTWAGCMVPTDDVIAHLLMMRGDEAGFWRQANQHDPASPEAGL